MVVSPCYPAVPVAESPVRERRKRRPPGQVRTDLVNAARELFAERGYAGASTREIASRAKVSEALLFRHFGTKAQLFDETVIQPFRDFVGEFVESWEQYSAADRTVEETCHDFINGLYQLLHEHREIVVALTVAHADDIDIVGGEGAGVGAELSNVLSRLERLVNAEIERRDLAGLDPPLTVRVTVGMVMAMALLDEWLFPGPRRPSEARLVHEMTMYMAHGVASRPAG